MKRIVVLALLICVIKSLSFCANGTDLNGVASSYCGPLINWPIKRDAIVNYVDYDKMALDKYTYLYNKWKAAGKKTRSKRNPFFFLYENYLSLPFILKESQNNQIRRFSLPFKISYSHMHIHFGGYFPN